MTIYALSDIHGHYDALCEALDGMDLSDDNNTLVLLGDYVDRGSDSLRVIEKVMRLQLDFPKRVIALRGNHDDEFCEWVNARTDSGFARAWRIVDKEFATTRSFLSEEDWNKTEHLLKLGKIEDAYQFAAGKIADQHRAIISWLSALPYFYETETQIFVHAGVLEFSDYCECDDDMTPVVDGDDFEMEYYWRTGTPPEMFTTLRLQNYGHAFYKDVICGHTPTSFVTGNDDFCGVAFDGASHYYVDGGVSFSGVIPVLAYDEITRTYQGPGL